MALVGEDAPHRIPAKGNPITYHRWELNSFLQRGEDSHGVWTCKDAEPVYTKSVKFLFGLSVAILRLVFQIFPSLLASSLHLVDCLYERNKDIEIVHLKGVILELDIVEDEPYGHCIPDHHLEFRIVF